MRAASPGLPPVDPLSGRRRTRRLIIIGLVMLVVAGAVALFLWQATERQSRQDRHALAEAVAQARAADARLRDRISALEPLLDDAEATRRTAVETLGDADSAVRSLVEALDVARALQASVASNAIDVSESAAGAAAALREDEDQLALIEPVMANLKTAQATAATAVTDKALRQAKTDFNEATRALDAALKQASAVLTQVDGRIAVLTSEPRPTVTATPSPTSNDAADGAEELTAKQLRAARRTAAKEAKRAAKAAAELADLQRASRDLTAALRAANAIRTKQIDQTNADELHSAARLRQAQANTLDALTAEVTTDHPALADQAGLEDLATDSAADSVTDPAGAAIADSQTASIANSARSTVTSPPSA